MSFITAAGATAGYNTTGVTTLQIKSIDNANTATASSFDVGSMTGLTKVTVANSSVIGTTADTLTIGSAASGTSVNLNANGSTQNVTVNYVSAATAGAADTVTLAVTGRSGAATIGTGFETVAITGGAAGRLASLTTSSATTVTVTGVDLRVDAALDSTVTSIDASKATGTVNLAATPGATFSAKGGTGTSDILAVSTLSSTHTVTGFETLVATAAATYDLTGAGATNLGVGVSAGAVSFTNAAATQNNIIIGGSQQRTTAVAATGDLTTGGTLGFALKTATGTADTVNIAVNNGGTATTGVMTIGGTTTVSGIENVNISTADFATVTFGGITDAVTGTGSFTLKATGSGKLNLGTVAISGAVATGTSIIDLSGNTGSTQSLTVTDTAGDNLTFTGGAGATTMTTSDVAAAKTATYTTGAGADVITVTAPTAAGTVNIVSGAGDDRINLDAATAQTTHLLLSINGGEGTADTIALTGTANARTINATVAGIERINAEATGAATTLNLTVATGYADTVLITDVSGQTQTINLNVSAAGSSVSAANFTALGWTNGTDVLSLVGSTGAETLTGSASITTTITGGAGADKIGSATTRTSSAILTAKQGTIGDSGAFTAPGSANGAVSTAGFDVITAIVGDTIVLAAAYTGTAANNTTNVKLLATPSAGNTTSITVADNTLFQIKGTYSASTNSFVGSATGTDQLLVVDTTAATGTSTYEGIVVVGVTTIASVANGVGVTITF